MKYIKYSLVVFLCLFSFYFSDRAILFIENQSPIMKTIRQNSDSLKLEAVNAIIDGNTIIPGKNGRIVNERESYLKMNDFGAFNETFYVYDAIKPEISLYDNLDKIIIGGSDNKSVSLIIESETLAEYLDEEGIFYSQLVYDTSDIEMDRDYINGNANSQNYESLNALLKRKKLNNKICLIGYSNLSLCKEYKYFLVSPTLTIYKSNLAQAKSQISGGQIIHLTKDLSLAEAKVIINQIRYKDLNFVYLSTLIDEE